MSFPLILVLLTLFAGVCKLSVWVCHKKDLSCWSWVPWCADFFVVLLVVLIIRSFLIEPFRIPSSSMLPTLKVGDYIAVNKFAYGLRLPVLHWKILPLGEPQRGDVVVFRYPIHTGVDYIKRVIGLPGDEVRYAHEQLYINGQEVTKSYQKEYLSVADQAFKRIFIETLPGGNRLVTHFVANDTVSRDFPVPYGYIARDPHCHYDTGEVVCHVPPGAYFVMGDNRDNSADSRFWGFVPEDHLLGKAVFIWFHAKQLLPPEEWHFGRIGPIRSQVSLSDLDA